MKKILLPFLLIASACAMAVAQELAISSTGRELLGLPEERQGGQPAVKIRVSSAVAEGNLLHHVDPICPPLASTAQMQGNVVLDAVINKQGQVEQLKPISGPRLLVTAAIDAVKQWTYSPYLLNGEPVAVATTVTIRFSCNVGTKEAP
jgi:TonB family protein